MLGGGCSVNQQKKVSTPINCEPIIEEYETIVSVPAELTLIFQYDAIPNSGNNGKLLDWAIACRLTNEAYKEQTDKVRKLK